MEHFLTKKRIQFFIVNIFSKRKKNNLEYSFVYLALDELLEYYQTEGVRHLRCPLTIPLRGHPLPAFAQRRGTSTVLHQAATEGQRDVLALLLNDANCPDIHSKNEEGLKRNQCIRKSLFYHLRKYTIT
jgi:hypothetical protein